MLLDGPITLRPRYRIFLLPAGFALVFMLIYFLQPAPDHALPVVSGILLLLTIVLLLLHRKSSIVIDGSTIFYRAPFNSTRIEWGSILKTYVVYHRRGKAKRLYWYFETSGQQKLRLSVQLYSDQSLQQLAGMVLSRSRDAITDDSIFRMAEGDFSWRRPRFL